MVGKFDQQLSFTSPGVLLVGGPVRWDAADRGNKVRIDARIEQNGDHDHCHMEVTAPDSGTFPQFSTWSMELETDKIEPGAVEAHAFATSGGRIIDQWDQPPELPAPVTVVI